MKLEEQELKDIAKQLTDIFTVQVKAEMGDRLLNKKELIKKLRTNPTDVDKIYINRPDFPKMRPEGMTDLRFSEKAVDQWIAENQIIN